MAQATYFASSKHGGECVRIDALAYCELVRDLEKRSHAENLGQVGADSSEHVVVEKDVALNFLGQVLHASRVGKAELCSALGK